MFTGSYLISLPRPFNFTNLTIDGVFFSSVLLSASHGVGVWWCCSEQGASSATALPFDLICTDAHQTVHEGNHAGKLEYNYMFAGSFLFPQCDTGCTASVASFTMHSSCFLGV